MLRIERIEALHVALLLAVVLAAWLTRWLDAWSVGLGGAVMGVNVWLMKNIVRRALRPGGPARTAVALGLLVGKFGLFLGLLGLLFWRVSIDGMSFAVGITLFLAASVVEAVRVGLRPENEE